jgi:hypothetical protein
LTFTDYISDAFHSQKIILVANPSKPFLYTPKGTPRRQVVINLYEQEIEQGYSDLENASIDLGNPESFGPEECRSFVSQLVEQIVGRKVQDDEDFFLCGCDRFVFRSSRDSDYAKHVSTV